MPRVTPDGLDQLVQLVCLVRLVELAPQAALGRLEVKVRHQ